MVSLLKRPVDVLVPLAPEDFAAYAEQSVRDYAGEKVRCGEWAQGDSLALARRSFGELLPQGVATPENWLFSITDDEGRQVGVLWIAAQERGGRRIAYVYDVVIHPGHRRRGHATRAFRALEAKVRELGLSGIALHVFGHNTQAQALYAKLGFVTTDVNMFKAV